MTRHVQFTSEASAQYLYWQGQDKKTVQRINQLIQEIQRSPFEGIGKPEPLSGSLSGLWSRRIDEVNRIVYVVNDERLDVVSCRFHY
jgi:toxin YoeB